MSCSVIIWAKIVGAEKKGKDKKCTLVKVQVDLAFLSWLVYLSQPPYLFAKSVIQAHTAISTL